MRISAQLLCYLYNSDQLMYSTLASGTMKVLTTKTILLRGLNDFLVGIKGAVISDEETIYLTGWSLLDRLRYALLDCALS